MKKQVTSNPLKKCRDLPLTKNGVCWFLTPSKRPLSILTFNLICEFAFFGILLTQVDPVRPYSMALPAKLGFLILLYLNVRTLMLSALSRNAFLSSFFVYAVLTVVIASDGGRIPLYLLWFTYLYLKYIDLAVHSAAQVSGSSFRSLESYFFVFKPDSNTEEGNRSTLILAVIGLVLSAVALHFKRY